MKLVFPTPESPIITIFQGSGNSVNFLIDSLGPLIVVITTHFSECISLSNILFNFLIFDLGILFSIIIFGELMK